MTTFAAPEDDQDQEAKDRSQKAREDRARLLALAAMPKDHVTGGVQFAAGMAGQGFKSHAAAADQINSAISDEMDSRVAQEREARRMQHEKDMEAMRQEGLIKRLQLEQESNRQAMLAQNRAGTHGFTVYGNGSREQW